MAAEAKKLTEQIEGSDGIENNNCGSKHVQESNVETATSADAWKQEGDVNHPLVGNT